MIEPPGGSDGTSRRLTRAELARAVRVEPAEIDELVDWGFLQPAGDGTFRPSDIQRVRAVSAMRTPGIGLDQLIEAFKERLFTLQPMDFLYPDPEVMTDTTPADLATELAIDEPDLVRLMTAAGFPAPVSGGTMRHDDVDLARSLVATARRLGGAELATRIARTYGDTARRAAESGVAMFAENVNSPVVNARVSDAERMEINRMAGQLMASSEALLGALYRRHLEHALLRQWAVSAETFLDQIGVRPARPQMHGLAFVDLTGYTALTQHSGDAAAMRLAERLAELADGAAGAHGGRVVKLLGDGAMLHFDDAPSAVRGAVSLVTAIGGSDLPPAHAGVHAGGVIERDGDYFGRTVNIAARISSQAEPGQTLVSPEVAAQVASDIHFRAIGERDLKGVGVISLYEATTTRI